MKKELFVNKKDISTAMFCSGFSWTAVIIGIVGLLVFDEYRFIFAGILIAAGIIMFKGMNILKDNCRCPGCGAGAMGNARDREYIGMLSSKKEFIICPVCKKKIYIK